MVIGRGDEIGPWVKADAVADALRQTHATVLIIADADVWTTGIPAAVENVRNGAAWAIPHRGVHRLTSQETTRVLNGGAPDLQRVEQRPYRGVDGGGILVIRRDAYEDCPLDPRFEGWGQEDQTLGFALTVLHGPPWRGREPLMHLWHPHPQRMNRRIGSPAGEMLRKRYARARHDPIAVRELIKEGQARCSPTS